MCGDEIMSDMATCRTRKEAAEVYARALDCTGRPHAFEWAALNDLVAEKWSKSGLKYVKQEAWKIRDAKIIQILMETQS